MCTSILNLVYTVVLCLGTGFIVASLFSPDWGHDVEALKNATGIPVAQSKVLLEKTKHNMLGLFSCDKKGGYDVKECAKRFQDMKEWERATVATLALSLACCVAALVWSVVVCFSCCCKSCLTPPLPILTGFATLFALISISIYAHNQNEGWDKAMEQLKGVGHEHLPKSKFGYSFFLGLAGILTLAVDTGIAVALVWTSEYIPF